MKTIRNKLNTLVHKMSNDTWDKYANMSPDIIQYRIITKLINVRRCMTNSPDTNVSLTKDLVFGG